MLSFNHNPIVLSTIVILAALILITEPYTPLGLAHGLLWSPLLLIAAKTHSLRTLTATFALSLTGVWVGAWLSPLPPPGTDIDTAIVNRALTSLILLFLFTTSYAFLRLKTQSELEHSKAIDERDYFAELAESLPIQIWTAHPDGNLDYIGHKLEILCGKGKSFIRDNWLDFLHPDDRERTINAWQRALETGDSYRVEFRLRTAAGNYLWHLTQAEPAKDDHGNIVRWLGSSTDITSLKELEQYTLQLSERFRSTLDSLHEGFLTLSSDCELLFANSNAIAILSKPQGELKQSLWKIFTPESAPMIHQELKSALKDGRPRHVVEEHTGLSKWLDLHINPTEEGVSLYLSDVTHEQHIQQELRLLRHAVSRLNDIILITEAYPIDKPGPKIVFANEAYERITGYKIEEVIGKSPRILQGPKTNRDDLRKIRTALENWQPVRAQLLNYKKNKDEIWLDINIAPVTDEQGKTTHWVSVERDVTHQKLVDEQLERAHRLESIGRLTGGIAHDFNNLLTVIIGNADMLVSLSEGDASITASAKMIMRASERAGQLTQSLLAFSRKQTLLPQTINLSELLDEFVPLLESSLGEKNTLSLHVDDALWFVEIDTAKFENMLINLAINARDAMPVGGKVSLTIKNMTLTDSQTDDYEPVPPGDYVMISFLDTGCGIKAENIDKIYEPFFTTKSPNVGTGLGLSMVFGFVKQSGGHIRVLSEEGKGTQFLIYLPKRETQELMPSEEKGIEKTSQSKTNHGLILVVEDNASILALAKHYIESAGYEVITAPDSDVAKSIIDAQPDIDMLFTDIIMPGEYSGYGLADYFLSKFSDKPVLYASGYNSELKKADIQANDRLMFLTKPYKRDELLEKLDMLL